MNQKLLLAALVVFLVVVAVQDRIQGKPADRKAGSGTQAACPVATLDLTKVFKNHEGFQNRSNKMRAEVEEAEQQLKGQRDSYMAQKQELDRHKKGTEEYDRLAAELAKLTETLNAQVNRQKETFLAQEAEIYIEIYDQIGAAIEALAEKRGFQLVLRFNGDPVDRTKPAEVLKELNKSVLYQHGIDITNDILEMVNGR